MKRHFFSTGLVLAILFLAHASPAQNYPFPNHTAYSGSHIKPDNYTQAELDSQAESFYDEWKAAYLKNDCGNSNEYYVFSGGGAINVSEAQGYGMMIEAYFAGYDPNAQTYFDGLYHFFKAHPSYINNNLMDWQQITCNDSASSDDDSASDGDIDIAFALLLADAQWGSNGSINYLAEAQTVIAAIMQDEINPNTWTVKLGDWSDAGNPGYYYGTRSSDFITDHFRSFFCASGDSSWLKVVDTCYALVADMQTNYSPSTGLIPDFITDVNTTPAPAGPNYLEGPYDGDYYYNACRVPWRLGTDYLLHGELRAKTAVNNINNWLVGATGANVGNISNGYILDGTAIYNWNDATFIGPFAVGAMADVGQQAWLNDLYTELVVNNPLSGGDYYSNTLKLLSMIVLSGNYWTPSFPSCQSSMPLDLLAFSVVPWGNKVKVNWQTGWENELDYFVVERSADGAQWDVLAEVAAAGDMTSGAAYEVPDENPPAGKLYYRLKQVDLDGQYVYSEVRTIVIGAGSDEWRFYPNPTSGQLVIKGYVSGGFKVYDQLGRDLSASVPVVEKGADYLILDFSSLHRGWYFFRVDGRMAKIYKQ